MLYWLPRIGLAVLAFAMVGLAVNTASSEDVANTMVVLLVGLGLFSLTLYVFPPERY